MKTMFSAYKDRNNLDCSYVLYFTKLHVTPFKTRRVNSTFCNLKRVIVAEANRNKQLNLISELAEYAFISNFPNFKLVFYCYSNCVCELYIYLNLDFSFFTSLILL